MKYKDFYIHLFENISPVSDEHFLSLEQKYKAGDENSSLEAQRILKNAAATRGYNIGPVFHGTNTNDFTKFDINKLKITACGKGFYFSNSEDFAKRYGSKIIKVFLKMEDPVINDETGCLLGGRNIDDGDSRWIKGGFPGLRSGQQIMLVRNPSQIKSCDPFTYADSGKLIPLSKRFDPSNDDIRY